jgi:hypothetical protein
VLTPSTKIAKAMEVESQACLPLRKFLRSHLTSVKYGAHLHAVRGFKLLGCLALIDVEGSPTILTALHFNKVSSTRETYACGTRQHKSKLEITTLVDV